MKKEVITSKQLKELIQQPEYTYREAPRHHIREFEKFNKWAPQEVYNLFDILTNQAGGTPPTLNHYLTTGVQMTRKHWHKESPEGRLAKWKMTNGNWEVTYLTWSEDIEKAVRWRLSRMYQSMMSEFSALTMIHEVLPDAFLFTSKDIDLVLGVDIVIALKTTNTILYAHVVKESSWADHNLKEKAKKSVPVFSKHNTKHIWKRRWTDSHLALRYDLHESERSTIINGHSLFREEYIREMLTKKFQEGNLDTVTGVSEFSEFHNFLKEFKIQEDGISGMVTHKGK